MISRIPKASDPQVVKSKGLVRVAIAIVFLFIFACVSSPQEPKILSDGHGITSNNDYRTKDNCVNILITIFETKIVETICTPIEQEHDHTETTKRHQNRSDDASDISIAKSDLLAQQRMAYWGIWICFFTALGIVLLILTLRETRIAAEAMSKIGKAQVSAYLSAIGGRFSVNNRELVIEIDVKNFGASPAHLVELQHVKLYTTDGEELGEDKAVMGLPSIFKSWFVQPSIGDVYIGTISPNNKDVGVIKIDFIGHTELDDFVCNTERKAISLIISGQVVWHDVFDRSNFARFDYSLGENKFDNAHDLSIGGDLVRYKK